MKEKLRQILIAHYGTDTALNEIIAIVEGKPPKELFNDIKEAYLSYYHNTKGEEYYWTAKDAGSVKHIVNKIRFKIRERGMEETDELIVRSFQAVLARIKDRWILDNLSLPIINSKFNEIIAQNGQNNKLRAVLASKQYD